MKKHIIFILICLYTSIAFSQINLENYREIAEEYHLDYTNDKAKLTEYKLVEREGYSNILVLLFLYTEDDEFEFHTIKNTDGKTKLISKCRFDARPFYMSSSDNFYFDDKTVIFKGVSSPRMGDGIGYLTYDIKSLMSFPQIFFY